MNKTIAHGGPTIGRAPNLSHPFDFETKDRIVAGLSLVIGFLFCQWQVIAYNSPTFSTFLFLLLIEFTSFFYIREKKKWPDKVSIFWMSIMGISTMYFLIFDNTPIHTFMLIFIILCYIMWIATASGTRVSNELSGFTFGDYVNQIFLVPFINFTAGFRSITSGNKNKSKSILLLVIGIIACLPLFLIITNLLISADVGFSNLMENFIEKIWDLSFIEYVINFILGIPVACYCYGFVYGNHNKRRTDIITYEQMNHRFVKLHAIPGIAVYGPLVVLNAIYILFFFAMGSYLFSAFSGDLPTSMTYAEYARKGFFELCGISAINLALIGFVYTFFKRKEGEYSKDLKILSGLLSVSTILLIITAMSKMLMYISSYGLTRLRVYTLWFMVVLMLVFVLILIWHFRKYNLGRPIIIGFMVLFLALGFSNSDGLIAKYNVKKYMNEVEQGISHKESLSFDTSMYTDMSIAVVPHLENLLKNTSDEKLKTEVTQVLLFHSDREAYSDGGYYEVGQPWQRFNIQREFIK